MELSNDHDRRRGDITVHHTLCSHKAVSRSDVCTRASVAQVTQDLVSNLPQLPVLPQPQKLRVEVSLELVFLVLGHGLGQSLRPLE